MEKVRVFFILFILWSSFSLEAKEKICLNMIVKNESEVIKRCLDSVIPVIDYWVIVDTGSNDGTQDIIKNQLKDIPGELYERPWKNFGENRTEAFKLAKGKGDYILFMDADDVLVFEHEPAFPRLTKDVYKMWRGVEGFTYIKPQLVKGNLPWKWVGVTHEYLASDKLYSSDILQTVKYVSAGGGASSKDVLKFWKNVKLLKEGLEKEPDNERYVFYLAESYRDAGEKGQAIEWYQKRINMGGWDEEVFWSKLQIAKLLQDIGVSTKIVEESYKEAHKHRPHRCEPIYHLAQIYMKKEEYQKAYDLIKSRESISKPQEKDSLFNFDWMENYGLLFQLSICSYYVGNFQESLDLCDKLLLMKNLPEWDRQQTESNRNYPIAKLQSKISK